MTTTLDRLSRMPHGQAYDRLVCLTCPDAPCFEDDEWPDHLAEAHAIPHDTTGSCRMALYSDTADFYVVAYHWTILGVEAEQFLSTPRPAESRPYWQGKAVTA